MHMNDLNRFTIPDHFVIDWDNVERVLRERNNRFDREILDRYFQKRPGGAGGTTTASSTSGEINIKPTPKAGEQWWIKMQDVARLQRITVKAITNATVEIDGLQGGRYERDYVKFVEKYVQPSMESESV